MSAERGNDKRANLAKPFMADWLGANLPYALETPNYHLSIARISCTSTIIKP